MFLKLGGESSFNNLVVQFGNQFYYKTTLEQFSTRITKTVNCAECPTEYKKYAQYIIPFVGRMVTEGEIKRDSWKLRDELHAALDELNNGAKRKEEVKTMNTATPMRSLFGRLELRKYIGSRISASIPLYTLGSPSGRTVSYAPA